MRGDESGGEQLNQHSVNCCLGGVEANEMFVSTKNVLFPWFEMEERVVRKIGPTKELESKS